ncbi:MAG: glycosyl transferase [Rhodobacteraceae bacterium]|nr:MAG: glycosyl transferase [Paracoccaceae bacterium]
MNKPLENVALVIIGRNEGARLVACLASVQGRFSQIVYVDSGSNDDSVAQAKAAGVIVHELDADMPFTAARARSAGFDVLKSQGPLPDFVQFIDGDCVLRQGWIDQALRAMQDNPKLGIVTGWRSEIHKDASIYNALCDFEWHRPAGVIAACGGDMLVRSTAFEQVGGFNAYVIAAEDDEFCVRVGNAGWELERLPVEMTRHDAAMTRFSQWWRRAVRSGHGFAQVGDLHNGYFSKERKRVWFYGAVLPMVFLVGLVWCKILALVVLGIYGLSYIRTVQGLIKQGLPAKEAASHSVLLTLSKFPNLLGMLTYYRRKRAGLGMNIIEYK